MCQVYYSKFWQIYLDIVHFVTRKSPQLAISDNLREVEVLLNQGNDDHRLAPGCGSTKGSVSTLIASAKGTESIITAAAPQHSHS